MLAAIRVDQEKRTIAALNLNFCNGSERTTLRKKPGDLYARIKSN